MLFAVDAETPCQFSFPGRVFLLSRPPVVECPLVVELMHQIVHEVSERISHVVRVLVSDILTCKPPTEALQCHVLDEALSLSGGLVVDVIDKPVQDSINLHRGKVCCELVTGAQVELFGNDDGLWVLIKVLLDVLYCFDMCRTDELLEVKNLHLFFDTGNNDASVDTRVNCDNYFHPSPSNHHSRHHKMFQRTCFAH
nr:MAG TPA: hypothetical protein [Caudoviricetes sp.]